VIVDQETFQLFAILGLGVGVLTFTAIVQYFNLRKPRSTERDQMQGSQTAPLL
jgi:hypothetical protein